MRFLICLMIFALPATAQPHRSGVFDYYVLSLSWSPNWCAYKGDRQGADQCHTRHDYGWILHGLWPQYHRGWPQYCETAHAPPSSAMKQSMVDIMGSTGLAQHQWKKHGVCSGFSAQAYFDLSRKAYDRVRRPAVFRKLDRSVRLPALVIEDAFLQANPAIDADGITITCRHNYIQEARICLGRDLKPVTCGQDVIRDCTSQNALFEPVR